jgi:hypothetical protein
MTNPAYVETLEATPLALPLDPLLIDYPTQAAAVSPRAMQDQLVTSSDMGDPFSSGTSPSTSGLLSSDASSVEGGTSSDRDSLKQVNNVKDAAGRRPEPLSSLAEDSSQSHFVNSYAGD